jgi:hypothetical protein
MRVSFVFCFKVPLLFTSKVPKLPTAILNCPYKRTEQVLPRSVVGEWVPQTMYTHVSNYKNDKIKGEKKTILNCP